MIEEIKEWKHQNGNVSYSPKELLQGLHIKVDKLVSGQISSNTEIAKNSNNIDWHNKGIYGIYCITIGILWFLIGN